MGVVRATAILVICARWTRAGNGRTPPCGGLRERRATLETGSRVASARRTRVWAPLPTPAAHVRAPPSAISPAVVRERLVRLRHAVGFLALLDRATAVLRGVDQ